MIIGDFHLAFDLLLVSECITSRSAFQTKLLIHSFVCLPRERLLRYCADVPMDEMMQIVDNAIEI